MLQPCCNTRAILVLICRPPFDNFPPNLPLLNQSIAIIKLTKSTRFGIIIATIKQMLQNISGDCVRINIMVGEQGITHGAPYWSFKYSSYTDIKVHLII